MREVLPDSLRDDQQRSDVPEAPGPFRELSDATVMQHLQPGRDDGLYANRVCRTVGLARGVMASYHLAVPRGARNPDLTA